MPALEIMPQCASMEEAQRRACSGNLPPRPPRRHEDDELVHLGADHETMSAKKITGFFRRNLRGMRRSFQYKRHQHHRKTAMDGVPDGALAEPIKPEEPTELEEMSGSFSSIGLKYWPKIREEEEEEPPEAF